MVSSTEEDLRGDLGIVEAPVLQHAHMTERALHHGFHAGAAILLQQMLFHGTGIDAHPDDSAVGLGGIHHAIHMLAGPDVAGLMRRPSSPASRAASARR